MENISKKSSNIVWSKSNVKRSEREKLLGQKGMILWMSGLSGSGKSTIGHLVERRLTDKGRLVCFLDGDNLRFGLNGNLGFSIEDRAENVRRIGEAALLLADCGVIVITGAVSPLSEMRDGVRKRAEECNIPFSEIYVKADVNTCSERDPKGLYKKALDGEIKDFTGISSPYEIPKEPELILDTMNSTPEQCAFSLFSYINRLLYESDAVVKAASKAAAEAGKVIMDVYKTSDFGVEFKGDKSPLTIADKRANDVITSILSESFPQYAILSEEKADDPSRLDEDFCFIVDPLDGTKEFIKRNGEFTVNIALSYLGKSILGVIYVPVTGDLYYSCDKKGAYLHRGITDISDVEFFKDDFRISVSEKTSDLVVMASRSHSDERTEKMLSENADKIGTTVSAGSSLKGCFIACGKADIYYRFGLTSEWDTAAMQNIVEEAGGVFMQTDDTPMRYNRPDVLNRKGFYILNNEKNKFKI